MGEFVTLLAFASCVAAVMYAIATGERAHDDAYDKCLQRNGPLLVTREGRYCVTGPLERM